jgi:hypothetical protein
VPPDNSAFMVSAYVVAATIIVVYALTLFVRFRKLR